MKGSNGALIRTNTPKRTEVNPAINAINIEKINANTKISFLRIFLIFLNTFPIKTKRNVIKISTKLSKPFKIKFGDNDS